MRLKTEVLQVLKSPGLIVILLLAVFNATADLWTSRTTYGTPTRPLTADVIDTLRQGFPLFLLMIAVFYGGELVWRERDRKVNEIIPKEGATSWFDSWMITAKSQNPATALAFLNHINEPDSQKKIAAATGYGICNQNAVDLVPKSYAEAYHLDNPDFIAGLDYWKAVPDRQKYLDVLNAVVAA